MIFILTIFINIVCLFDVYIKNYMTHCFYFRNCLSSSRYKVILSEDWGKKGYFKMAKSGKKCILDGKGYILAPINENEKIFSVNKNPKRKAQ